MGRTESSAPTNGSADVLTGRRDTRVPPYRVRRFYGAGRVVRPYDGTSYPKGICSAALHCRTPSPTMLYRRQRPPAKGRGSLFLFCQVRSLS